MSDENLIARVATPRELHSPMFWIKVPLRADPLGGSGGQARIGALMWF